MRTRFGNFITISSTTSLFLLAFFCSHAAAANRHSNHHDAGAGTQIKSDFTATAPSPSPGAGESSAENVSVTKQSLGEGIRLDLSGLRDTSGREFPTSSISNKTVLIFISTVGSASQARHWGDAIKQRYDDRAATWDEVRDQKLVIVPVLNLTSLPSFVPQGMVSAIVKQMRGGEDVLLDWQGALSANVTEPQGKAALVVLGPEGKVQVVTYGDYDANNSDSFFAVIDRDLNGSSGTQLTTTTPPKLNARNPSKMARSRSRIVR
jgi:hypothetical protein